MRRDAWWARVLRRPRLPATAPEFMGQSRPAERNLVRARRLRVNPLLAPVLVPQPQIPSTPSPPRTHNARSPLAIRARRQIHPVQAALAALPLRSRNPPVPRRLGMPQPQAINPMSHRRRGPTLSPARNRVPRAQLASPANRTQMPVIRRRPNRLTTQPPGPNQSTDPRRPRRLCQVTTRRPATRKHLRRNFLEPRPPHRNHFSPPLAPLTHRHHRRAKELPPEALILPSLRHFTPQRIAS